MRVRLTPQAERDLEEIAEFIAADNPSAAVDTVLAVLDAVVLLSEQPNLGRPGRIPGTRELVIAGTRFIAPYRIRDVGIDVLRVLHAARRWPDRFI